MNLKHKQNKLILNNKISGYSITQVVENLEVSSITMRLPFGSGITNNDFVWEKSNFKDLLSTLKL